MGPFSTALRQLKVLVVDIDYFTKWVEAKPLVTITEKSIRSFVWGNIICRYRIPRALISDNGKQFDNSAFRDFEVTNRTLLKIIKTRLKGGKGI